MNDSHANPFAQKTKVSLAHIARDCFGRGLELDDEVFFFTARPLQLRVANIAPVLDPAQPPNLLYVHLGVMMTLTVKREVPVHELMRTRTAAEAGPSNFKLLETQKQES